MVGSRKLSNDEVEALLGGLAHLATAGPATVHILSNAFDFFWLVLQASHVRLQKDIVPPTCLCIWH